MLGVIIPARNEEKAIHFVINNLIRAGISCEDIFVVDNNSSDKTKINSLELGVNVLDCKKVGYQSALNHGLNYLIENAYSKFLIVDGDNEITFQAIQKAIKSENKYSLIVGSRQKIKRIGERIINNYFHRFFGVKDIMCGLKLGELGRFNQKNNLSFGVDLLNLSNLDERKVLNLPISLNPRNSSRLGNTFVVNIRLLFSLLKFHCRGKLK
jgi:glycosyltransferase involved in cell wall biosynthesis